MMMGMSDSDSPVKVSACFATSLDGKISPADTTGYVRLTSTHDIEHLQALRETVDAVCFGGETFRAYPRPHRGRDRSIVPVHVILTESFNLPPGATYFMNQPPVPTMIFSPAPAPEAIRRQYPDHIHWHAFPDPERPIQSMLARLKKIGIGSILLEGGGEIMAMFLKERAVEELYLTLAPLYLGGKGAPNILGDLALGLEDAIRTEMISMKRVGNELYLRLRLLYPDG